MATKQSKKVENSEKEIALELFHNMRGKYIIGQALYYAQKYLMDMPVEKREVSNAEDMQLLGNNLFQLGYLPTKMLNEEFTYDALLKSVEEKENNELKS
tara:strand:+ start:1463 stop:1759 length:297 start_codon:yes stop_codon:yes gene_type:complete